MTGSGGAVSRWWDVAVLGTCAVTAAIIVVPAPHAWTSWAAAGSVAATAAVFLVFSRRALAAVGGPLRRWAAAPLIVTGAIGTYFDPTAAFMQAILFPLIWVLSSTPRSAVLRSATLSICIGIATGLGTHAWVATILGCSLSFAFAIALGAWITRIEAYGTERDRLLTELRAAQDEVAALERQAGVTEERARVAREIHDTIAQSLTGLVMTAQRAASKGAGDQESIARDLALIEDLAQEALAEARTLVASYTPVTVTGGLVATLRALADRFSAETGVTAVVSGGAPVVDREAEVVLLRCVQEALANVRKHAQARTVQICLTEDGVTIRDDGVGIQEPGHGYGLAGMSERVRLVGGTLEVGDAAPSGTTVRVTLPRLVRLQVAS